MLATRVIAVIHGLEMPSFSPQPVILLVLSASVTAATATATATTPSATATTPSATLNKSLELSGNP
jgi:hypothetical protein